MQISNLKPTARMVEKLRECHEKETANGDVPCLPDEMKSSLAGLYKRGLIATRMVTVNNKKQLCIYVSDAGKKFLASLEETVGK